MRESIVLYPAPRFHHMVALVGLGKLILQHHPEFSITILVPAMSLDTATTSTYIHQLSQTNIPITFFTLPSTNLPQSASSFEVIRLNEQNVADALGTISMASTVLALITSGAQVSYHPHIPTYYYFTSCAYALAFFLHLPTIHNQTDRSVKHLNNTLLHLPGLPPFEASNLPETSADRDDPAYHYFLHYAICVFKSEGVIVNTFEALEPQAIKAATQAACILNNDATPTPAPPIYHIGPLVADSKDRAVGFKASSSDSYTECLTWLDAQPCGSVVFLSFGSKGTFSEVQLKEMAMGLERSGHRFLWVVRSTPTSSNSEPDLEVLLPEGFMKRTKERGLVVKSWAPQSDILSHESVGGFVTHCGWNSVVEAVFHGVPMVAWPLYAEQRMNSAALVEQMKLAIAVEKVEYSSSSPSPSPSSKEELLVSAEELEKKVRQLMGSEGKCAREKSLGMKAMGKAAWSNGGSSLSSLSKMVASWKKGH